MSELAMSAIERKDVGKGASRRLRHADLVPGIVYGGDADPMQITVEGRQVRKALEAEAFYSSIINLVVDGTSQQALLKDVQRHPASGAAMHLDFMRVDATHEVTTHVPLHFINEATAVGVKAGGVVVHNLQDIEVRCLPSALPEFIEVDMAAIELGGSVHLSDLTAPAGVVFTQLALGQEHDLPVVSINATRASGAATAEADETTDKE